MISAVGIFLFASCTQEFDITPSEVTYLPFIELQGDATVNLGCGDTYNPADYSAKAYEGGEEITLNEVVEGSYYGASSVDGPDIYTVSYSALNKDNIPGSAFRTINYLPCSGDMASGDISGVYKSTIVRNGVSSPTVESVIIKQSDDGKFLLSDAIGGWYDFHYGYGWHYAATGLVLTPTDGGFSSDQVIGVGDFGGELTLDSFNVDPATGTIVFTTTWSFGYEFVVTLERI